MQRIRLDIAYDGTNFHGWAAQPGLRTVQGEIQRVLSTITRQQVSLTVAGRTDAGVHAEGQVAHFDLPMQIWRSLVPEGESHARLELRINGMLAQGTDGPRGTADVLVTQVRAVEQSFDARFSALWRRYKYRLADTLGTRSPLSRNYVSWVDCPAPGLDVAQMNSAAQALLGEHDFLSFCKPREGATTIRTLQELNFQRDSDGVIVASVQADAFCHSMVRSLVGASILVGRGARNAQYPQELLSHPSRNQAAPLAPPQGLSLIEVGYGENPGQWATQQVLSRRRRDDCDCDPQ